MQNLSQMTDVIDPLATAAKSEPENIGHRVCSDLNQYCYFHFLHHLPACVLLLLLLLLLLSWSLKWQNFTCSSRH